MGKESPPRLSLSTLCVPNDWGYGLRKDWALWDTVWKLDYWGLVGSLSFLSFAPFTLCSSWDEPRRPWEGACRNLYYSTTWILSLLCVGPWLSEIRERVSDWPPPRAQRPSRTSWSICVGHFLHEAKQPELRVNKRNLSPGGTSLLCCYSENSLKVSQWVIFSIPSGSVLSKISFIK